MSDVTKTDVGAIAGFARSKKYGLSGVVVLGALGLSAQCVASGNLAAAVDCVWAAAVASAGYAVAQAFVEGMSARKA